MNAPDRSDAVRKIWNDHPPTTLMLIDNVMQFPNDDVRRVYLLGTLIPELNKIDEGWGALIKTERNPPFIPSDIVVWRDTREHWDVLTNTGPAWQYDGLIDRTWEWLAVGLGGVPNIPPVEPPSSVDPGMLKLEIDKLRAELTSNVNLTVNLDNLVTSLIQRIIWLEHGATGPDYRGTATGQVRVFGIGRPFSVTVTSKPVATPSEFTSKSE